ncbi:ABC transporter substrate-binding protein [Sulfobacillus thermotolerans]|uniref:ABC transporter substrate-binding protein n=1 Tax=Sulfobacillus thermotolerans TaxID=338644 RepID=A0ABM6RV92_9FIRM|nr:ABC transporter substrate-binding protein [Sulfobacillus thermotolerans]
MLEPFRHILNREAGTLNRLIKVATSGLIVIGLAGCGTPSSNAAPRIVPHFGGTAVYALPVQTSPNWFFPLVSLNADTVVNFETDLMMYKPLVYFNQQGHFEPQHSLASSVTWNASDTVYTIHLNPKWHWSNGHRVTAQDVVFTWDIMQAGSMPNNPYSWAFSGEGSGGIPATWKSVVAPNSHTVVITTTVPRNPEWFIRNGLMEIIPVPRSIWDRYPKNMAKEMSFINSVANLPTNSVYQVVDGPYRLASYQPGNYWTFVPNPHYDGHKSYLSRVVFKYETSSAAEFAALRTGAINVGYLGVGLLGARSEIPHDKITALYRPGFDYVALNLNPAAPHEIGKAFSELPVRQALQMGVDQTGMIAHIFHGYGVIDDTSLAPLPKTFLFNPALTRPLYPFNPARGKQLLLKNGWREVHGVMTKQGMALNFTLDYAAGTQSAADMVQLMKSNWAQEGIEVHLVPQTFDTVVSYGPSNASKWAMVDWSDGAAWTYGNDPYPTGGSLFATDAGENGGDYSNHEMNLLIQATYEPGTPMQTLHRLYRYEMYVAQQLPGVIFLPMEPKFIVHADTIHGVSTELGTFGNIHPNYWWVSP